MILRSVRMSIVVAIALALSSSGMHGQLPTQIGRLSWLAGCWEWTAGNRHGEEQWMKPRGGTMLGISRTVLRDSTVEFEFIRVEERDGRLHYVAAPSGQASATFSSTELANTSVMFANPEHDFPQRIIYRLRGDSLLARVEGTRNGSVRGIDFPMRRVACDLR